MLTNWSLSPPRRPLGYARALGSTKVRPKLNGEFHIDQPLGIYMQFYNLSVGHPENVSVDVKISQGDQTVNHQVVTSEQLKQNGEEITFQEVLAPACRIRHALLRHAEGASRTYPIGTTSKTASSPTRSPPTPPTSPRATRRRSSAMTRSRRARFEFRWVDQFNLSLDPDTARHLPRRDAAQGGAQGGAFLLHVRPEILLDEDHPGRAGLCATLGDNEKAARSPHPEEGASAPVSKDEAEAGMAEMSKKFLDLGAKVYVEAEKVKESNKAL